MSAPLAPALAAPRGPLTTGAFATFDTEAEAKRYAGDPDLLLARWLSETGEEGSYTVPCASVSREGATVYFRVHALGRRTVAEMQAEWK